MYLKEEFMSAPIDIYNNNQSSIIWAHSMKKGSLVPKNTQEHSPQGRAN